MPSPAALSILLLPMWVDVTYEECGIGICLLFCGAREEVAGVSSRQQSTTEPSSHSGSLVSKIIRVSERLYGKLLTEFDQLELFS